MSLAHYQGYIQRIGFEYTLFPISWDDDFLWTYAASRIRGKNMILLWVDFTKHVISIILLSIYILARA